ncbi:hypothetical protein NLJ89_g11305 [Agrocybe chaxingu]|uniref:RABX5 catalytic core helical domain-containing protein n=1 Tax=Agrocybe chaxingu TaxID=84603 RepID=A0A9W8MR99_9AGAR|nr:hypothetical protein NLJ89_g11305 [Agrocybe chaxingu]
MTPADLDEAHRTHEPDDVYGDCLRPLADRFIEQTQVYITDTIATGLNDMLGSVRLENNNKEHHFRRLRSFDKYGLVLHRLVFACLRFYVHGTWTSNYKYPDIDPTQLEALRALDLSVRECMENDYTEATDRAFRTACVALFKHLRHEYAASRKMEKDSSTASSNSLTRVAAALEYSIRASFLHLAVAKADVDGTDKSEDYLSDQKASVMSFLCHSHSFLKTIRGDEYNRESFAFADLMQTRLTHRRGVITLKGIKELVEGQYESYMDTLRRRAFFGEIPDDMFPDIEIEGLFDDIHRNTVGYSFLVEPKNDLTRYRSRYAKWLLSDEDRRRKFISNIDGRPIFAPITPATPTPKHDVAKEVLSEFDPLVASPEEKAARDAWETSEGHPPAPQPALVPATPPPRTPLPPMPPMKDLYISSPTSPDPTIMSPGAAPSAAAITSPSSFPSFASFAKSFALPLVRSRPQSLDGSAKAVPSPSTLSSFTSQQREAQQKGDVRDTGKAVASGSATPNRSGSRTSSPVPKPAPDGGFDFQKFLDQMKTKSAEPVSKYLRSFLSNFAKRTFTVNDQIKIINDFLSFIAAQMRECDVWRNCSDAEFENAMEGMEKLVMNRLYEFTFTPQLVHAVPPRPITTDDLERDRVLSQRIALFGWIEEKHLDIPEGEGSKGFLMFAQQGDRFINRFRNPEKLQSEAGYYLSSLMGAVSFIETMDHTSLSNITQEEFEKYVLRLMV